MMNHQKVINIPSLEICAMQYNEYVHVYYTITGAMQDIHTYVHNHNYCSLVLLISLYNAILETLGPANFVMILLLVTYLE